MEVILGRGVRFSSILRSSPAFVIKNFPESVRSMRCTDTKRWRLTLSERYPRCKALSFNYVPLLNNIATYQRPLKCNVSKNVTPLAHNCDTKRKLNTDSKQSDSDKKMTIFQKMKQLTKDYWHVLIPVHVVTSIGWLAIFYASAKNGVDIVQIMEYMNLSEKYLEMMRNSSAGHWAVAYALYKIFTPLRYTVTVGGTTLAIRHLNRLGLLKAPTFRKQTQQTTESNKSMAEPKTEFKPERQTEPPKT